LGPVHRSTGSVEMLPRVHWTRGLLKGNTMEIGSDSTYQHAQRLTLITPTLISAKNLLRERERESRPKMKDKKLKIPFILLRKYLYD
jgi:hypothetical protein